MAAKVLLRLASLFAAAIAIAIAWAWSFNMADLSPLEWLHSIQYTNGTINSDDPSPQTYVLSKDPVVVYVKDFVSAQEAAHLVQLANGRFAPSPMWDNDGKPHIDKAYRHSMTAKLDRTDDVIKGIEKRATSFPFYTRFGDFMPIVVQNYGISGQYRDHYDWFDDAHAVGGNIASTFFVYIHANCTGGGTNFARLTPPDDEMWCEFIDCDRPLDEGVTFKPILGNAIYWENLHEDDAGHQLTLHAGMPVTTGNKMGMNMWTWKVA